MTDIELHSLSELLETFRRRAKSAWVMSEGYKTNVARSVHGSSRWHEYRSNAERTKGKASAYSNAADDLERVIRSVDDLRREEEAEEDG